MRPPRRISLSRLYFVPVALHALACWRVPLLSVGGQPEYLSQRHAEDALLLPIQPGHRARARRARCVCASTTWARAACMSPTRCSSTDTRRCATDASRPFRINQPLDHALASVNEFRTDAGSNYTGLQTSVTQAIRQSDAARKLHLSHCLDEVSNGGLLPFSTLGILSPLPGDLRQQYGNCDYDVRHNISAFGIYQIPFHSSHAVLAVIVRRLAGVGDGLPAQRTALQRAQRSRTPRTTTASFRGAGRSLRDRVAGRSAVSQDARIPE